MSSSLRTSPLPLKPQESNFRLDLSISDPTPPRALMSADARMGLGKHCDTEFEIIEISDAKAHNSFAATSAKAHRTFQKRFSTTWARWTAMKAAVPNLPAFLATSKWKIFTQKILVRSEHVFLTSLSKLLKDRRKSYGLRW